MVKYLMWFFRLIMGLKTKKQGDITRNFSRREFACKCGCGFDDISLKLVEKLQKVRDLCGFPLTVNSGCRCELHNKRVGGRVNSAHLTGKAVDIAVKNSWERYFILDAALRAKFSRIGIYETYVHLDIDTLKPQRVLWLKK